MEGQHAPNSEFRGTEDFSSELLRQRGARSRNVRPDKRKAQSGNKSFDLGMLEVASPTN